MSDSTRSILQSTIRTRGKHLNIAIVQMKYTHSNFNVYKDYLQNLKEFNKIKEVGVKPGTQRVSSTKVDSNSRASIHKPYDLSPGKQVLNDREMDKMMLQGVFDFPHNKVNDQNIGNIDMKEADNLYSKKRQAFDKKLSFSGSDDQINFNRYHMDSNYHMPPPDLPDDHQNPHIQPQNINEDNPEEEIIER